MPINKGVTVPDYSTTYKGFKKQKKKKIPKVVDPFAFSHEDSELKKRISILQKRIDIMKNERTELIVQLKKREQMRNEHRLRKVSLYALKLEDNCWYIGMSYDPIKRFIKHKSGKGASWTKLHKPLEIHEVRETNEYIQDMVAKSEDDMTIEYMLKYGSDRVRGGGWCQLKPRLPDIVKDNERER